MKQFFLQIIFCFLFSISAFAQFSEGKITGKILEKGKNTPLEGVEVSITSATDTTTILKGNVTNAEGEFVLEKLPQGRFILTAKFVGYRNYVLKNLFLGEKMPEFKISKMEMEEQSGEVGAVVIEVKREYMQITAEGIIITPENNPTQSGGTATDVLRDAPNVQVDANGNISLRGGRPNILINGRQSGFGGMGGRGGGRGGDNGLDQISAEDIESVEINTNPSSKFDADGVGGMINIRLKRDRKPGTHFNGSVGIGNRERFNANFRANKRTTKWNTYFGFGTRMDNRLANDNTDRFTFSNNTYFNQARDFKIHSENYNIRAGVEYNPTEKSSFNFETILSSRQSWNDGALNTKLWGDNIVTASTRQDNNSVNNGNSLDLSLAFKQDFEKKKQSFSASISTSIANGDQTQNLANFNMANDGSQLNTISKQNNQNDTWNALTTLQVDYAHPLGGEKGLLEVGYKGIMRNLKTGFGLDRFNLNTQIFETDNLLSNNFKYDENVHASYVAYKNSIGKFDYSAGLRFEQVWYDGSTTTKNNAVTAFNRDYFNIFPTARIAYNMKEGEFVKLSYSKRIDRPSFDDLNPFVDYSNPLNLRKGNQNLKPELIHIFEVGHNKSWATFGLTTNIFYRYRENLVQRITQYAENSTLITINSPDNIGSSNAVGLEVISMYDPVKWFGLNASFSAFQTNIDAGNNTGLQNANINSQVQSWTARANANFTFWKNSRAQVGFNYNSPTAVAQGENLGFYMVMVGFSKPIMKDNRGNIGLNVRDLFYSMRFGSTTNTSTFSQTSTVLRDTRQIFLTFRYRI